MIDHLQGMGYTRSVEAGRGIIQDQMAIGGSALPWADRALFAELMLCWELRSYRMAAGRAAPVFFDRGVPDIVGYLRWDGLPVPDHVHAAAKAFRYHRRVLVAPPGQLPAARHATGHAGGTCVVWPPLWAIVISASGGGELRYERYSPGVGSVSLCGGGGIWDRHSDSVRF